jgi:Lactonase, 7-bladed beta-propeller
MTRPRSFPRLCALVAAGVALSACPPQEDAPDHLRSLAPYPNPMGPDDPRFVEQPDRDKPQELVLSEDGSLVFISLPGTADRHGDAIAVVERSSGRVVTRIQVGAGPTGLALHPQGRFLVVLNRFSNYASIIDTRTLAMVSRAPMDFYAQEAVFTPDGKTLFVTNRMHDAVIAYRVDVGRTDLGLTHRATIGVGQNPRDIAISADGRTVAAGAFTGLDVSLIDVDRLSVRARIDLGAPSNGLAFVGDFLVVATLSASTHHEAHLGPDTNGDGEPGDGTPNVNFQDLQNEIAVIDVARAAIAHRYTSDTICCKDFRDVDPRDTARGGALLPAASTWIVGGALPEQVAADLESDPPRVFVSYSASNELQAFDVDTATGALAPRTIFPSLGHSPHGLIVAGDELLVVERLSEQLSAYRTDTGAHLRTTVVGDVTGGQFPATDAEIGELVNDVTAPFAIDGDQACVSCHRENGNLAKALSMPLTVYPGVGLRMVMSYRGAADTRPWFFEAAMDEGNFRPVINEFARIENFCCSDYTMWPSGAPADCASNPPTACAEASNTSSGDGFLPLRDASRDAFAQPRPTPAGSRDEFFLDAAEQLIGTRRSFGTGLFHENPVTGERTSIPLDFDGVTRSLGLFLLTAPRLLPNPFDPDTPSARRGRALFEDDGVGCALCHPSHTFAASTDNNPSDVPLRMDPVVSPLRRPDGMNLDLLTDGFQDVFPETEVDTCTDVCSVEQCTEAPQSCNDIRNVRFGAPSLRGIWDRADMFLHDGRARSLREVVCTPGHPALREGEVGFNERDGVPNTHGSTSQLTPSEIEDLVTYMRTL